MHESEDDGFYYGQNPWQSVTPEPSNISPSSSLPARDSSLGDGNSNEYLPQSEPSPLPSPVSLARDSHNGDDNEQSSQHAEAHGGNWMVMQNAIEYIILLSMVGVKSTKFVTITLILLTVGQICDAHGHDIPLNTPSPPHDSDRGPHDWTPYNSRNEFELANFLFHQN